MMTTTKVEIDVPETSVQTVISSSLQRRNSTGGLNIRIIGQKVLPNYLKPSAGSCHDSCKYGVQYVFKANPRTPFPKKWTATPDKSKNAGYGAISEEERIKLESSPNVIMKSTSWSLMKGVHVKKLEVHRLSSTMKEAAFISKEASSPGDGTRSAERVSRVKAEAPTMSSLPVRRQLSIGALPSRSLVGSSRRKKNETKSPRGIGSLPRSPMAGSSWPKVNLPRKFETLSRSSSACSSSLRNRAIFMTKTVDALKSSPLAGSSSQRNSENFMPRAKVTPPSSPRTNGTAIPRRPQFLPSSPLKGSSSPRNKEIKRIRGTEVTRFIKQNGYVDAGPKKVPSSLKFSSSKPSSRRSLSINSRNSNKSLTNQSTPTNAVIEPTLEEKIPEKTLYVIQPEDGNQNAELDPPEDNALACFHDGEQTPPVLPSLENENSMEFTEATQQIGIVSIGTMQEMTIKSIDTSQPSLLSPEDEDCSKAKLKVNQRKPVPSYPKNSSPTATKYRQIKTLGGSQNCKTARTRGKLKSVTGDGNPDYTITESSKVVLRNNDAEGKITTPNLLNKMIKETASKLVKAKKSKVKALVGAYESLISLQDDLKSPRKGTAAAQ